MHARRRWRHTQRPDPARCVHGNTQGTANADAHASQRCANGVRSKLTGRFGKRGVSRYGGLLTVAIFIVVWLGSTDAPAQTLNLGPGSSMPEGSRLAIDQAIAGVQARNAGSTGTGDSPTRASAERFRAFVLAMLQRAGELAESGSTHAVVGWKLAASMSEFDRIAQRMPEAPAEARNEFESAIAALPVMPSDIPADRSQLDAMLQASLGPIRISHAHDGGAARVMGWVRAAPIVDATVAARRTAMPRGAVLPSVPQAVTQIAASITQRAEKNDASPKVQTVSECVWLGMRAWEPLPTWVSPARQAWLRSTVEQAITGSLGSPGTDEELETLARAGLLVTLIAHVSNQRDLSAGALRDVRNLILSAMDGEPALRAGAGRGRAGQRTLHDAGAMITLLRVMEAAAEPPPDPARPNVEATLVREVKPAYRLLVRKRTQTRETAVEAALRNIQQGGGPTDPALLASTNALKQAEADVQLLIAISDWLSASAGSSSGSENISASGTSTRVTEDPLRKQVAARVLKLGQLMGEPMHHDAAAAAMRILDQVVSPREPWSAERVLSGMLLDPDGLQAWNVAAGGRAEDLLATLRTARAELARGFGDHADDPLDVSMLRPLDSAVQLGGAILEAVHSVVRVSRRIDDASESKGSGSSTDSPGHAITLNDWPGWHTDAIADQAMLEGATELLGRAIEAIVRRRDAEARRAMEQFHQDYAYIVLLDTLTRNMEPLGEKRGGAGKPANFVFSIAPDSSGGPLLRAALGDVWLADQRESLARICRQVAEHDASRRAAASTTGARKEEHEEQAAACRAYVNQASAAVLNLIASQRVREEAIGSRRGSVLP